MTLSNSLGAFNWKMIIPNLLREVEFPQVITRENSTEKSFLFLGVFSNRAKQPYEAIHPSRQLMNLKNG
jgi:hypothetical protein